MQWAYSHYPTRKGRGAVYTDGTVEIKMTRPPALEIAKLWPHADANITPRVSRHAQWVVVGASEDLERFIRGKYWCKIECKLAADHLRARGMDEAADAYEYFASTQAQLNEGP